MAESDEKTEPKRANGAAGRRSRTKAGADETRSPRKRTAAANGKSSPRQLAPSRTSRAAPAGTAAATVAGPRFERAAATHEAEKPAAAGREAPRAEEDGAVVGTVADAGAQDDLPPAERPGAAAPVALQEAPPTPGAPADIEGVAEPADTPAARTGSDVPAATAEAPQHQPAQAAPDAGAARLERSSGFDGGHDALQSALAIQQETLTFLARQGMRGLAAAQALSQSRSLPEATARQQELLAQSFEDTARHLQTVVDLTLRALPVRLTASGR